MTLFRNLYEIYTKLIFPILRALALLKYVPTKLSAFLKFPTGKRNIGIRKLAEELRGNFAERNGDKIGGKFREENDNEIGGKFREGNNDKISGKSQRRTKKLA